VAADYGVSRIPVREALRLLAGEGLVVLRTHRGAVVTAHTAEEIGELFDLRALLERDLVVRAAAQATAADVARAERVLSRLDDAYRRNDPQAWAALNSEFHRCLWTPARRPRTQALVEGLGLMTERAIRLYHRIFTGFGKAQADHRQILRLVRAGKAEAAGAAVERHVLFTKGTLVAALEARHPAPGAGSRASS
jgi:DNA-binding GntR family transcriptional regulator